MFSSGWSAPATTIARVAPDTLGVLEVVLVEDRLEVLEDLHHRGAEVVDVLELVVRAGAGRLLARRVRRLRVGAGAVAVARLALAAVAPRVVGARVVLVSEGQARGLEDRGVHRVVGARRVEELARHQRLHRLVADRRVVGRDRLARLEVADRLVGELGDVDRQRVGGHGGRGGAIERAERR